jgi:predicted ArsR family transcriptional regulator
MQYQEIKGNSFGSKGEVSLRKEILHLLKMRGEGTISQLAKELCVTREAVRIQIRILSSIGWVAEKDPPLSVRKKRGRPAKVFFLTPEGDRFFPKSYEELIRHIFSTLKEENPQILLSLLGNLVKKQVQLWEPRIRDKKSLREKLEILRNIYQKDDPYTEIIVDEGNHLCLVERNCPFLSTALEFPILCTLTLSTLSHLLGHRVIRTKKFQSGDGCCTFKILSERIEPTSPPLFLEEEEQEVPPQNLT